MDFPSISQKVSLTQNVSKKTRKLPTDIWVHIASHLDYIKDLQAVRTLNKQNYSATWKSCAKNLSFTITTSFPSWDTCDFSHVTKITVIENDDTVNLDDNLVHLKTIPRVSLKRTSVSDDGISNLLGQGSKVVSLNLSGCMNVAKLSFPHFKGLQRLKLLDTMTNVTDDEIYHLRGTKQVHLDGVELITDKSLEYLSGVKNLTLSNCQGISDDGFKHLEGIETLTLNSCHNITDSMLKHLKGISKLRIYDSPFVTGVGLHHLKGIHTLELPENPLLKDEHLIDLTGIKRLIIPSSQVSDKGFHFLKGIHSLDISANENITDDSLSYLKGIQRLSVAENAITNDGLASLSGIKVLDLCFCDAISDDGFKYLKGIEGIRLTGCPRVKGTGFTDLFGIQWMSFSGCRGVDDELLKNIQDKLPCLQFLDVSYCQMWTNNGCKYLNGIPNLNLEFCTQLSDKGIKDLMPNFDFLNLNGIQVTLEGIAHLRPILKKRMKRKWKEVSGGAEKCI